MENLLLTLHDGDVKLYTRTSGRRGTIQYSIKVPGETHTYERKSTGVMDLRIAQEIAEQRYQTMLFRVRKGVAAQGKPFELCADLYRDVVSKRADAGLLSRKKVIQDVQIIERYLIPFFVGVNIEDITTADIIRYHEWRERIYDGVAVDPLPYLPTPYPNRHARYTENSKVYNQNVLSRIFVTAIEHGIIAPMDRPTFPKTYPPEDRRGTFTQEQFQRIIAELERRLLEGDKRRHWRHQRQMMLNLVLVLAYSGLRVHEALSLRWQDVTEFQHEGQTLIELHVDGKTGKRSVVPMPECGKAIRDIRVFHPDLQPHRLVFVNYRGESQKHYMPMFNIILTALNLQTDNKGQDLSLYSLRHFYITQRLLAGVDIHLLARNCGNSVKQIERHYSHVIPRMNVRKLTQPPLNTMAHLD